MNPSWPGTATQAVARLLSTLIADEQDAVCYTRHDDFIMLHFSLGMHIRNEFGLWQGSDELLRSCYPEVSDPYLLETIKHDPDRASARVIDALWRRVQSSR